MVTEGRPEPPPMYLNTCYKISLIKSIALMQNRSIEQENQK